MTDVDVIVDTQLASLLEIVPGAIIGVARDGAIVFANSAASALFGYEHDAFAVMSIEHVLPRFDVGVVPEPVDGSESTISPGTRQLAARRADGSEFAADAMLTWTHMRGRSVTLLALRDVTERRRLSAATSGIPEVSNSAAVAIDRRGRIASANPEAEELFGYTGTELVDLPVNLLVPEPAQSPTPPVGSRRVPGEMSATLGVPTPLEGRRKDGSAFPVEISLAAIDTDEGPMVSAEMRDASDRSVAEREQERADVQLARDLLETRLHQSHRLESLGQLAGGIAHDFNNLLAAILNYVAFVSDEIDIELADRPVDGRARLTAVLNDVAQIGAAAERAAGLTHQLLSFARREVRHLEVIDINEVLGEVETLLRRTLGEHVTLVTRGARDLKAVRADRGQIDQVLLNLAVNARDAMPNGGTLSVETDNFEADDEYAALHPVIDSGPFVRVRVIDTGAGMDQATLDRVFEPFFSTKPKDKGTGLGLATVYGIISQTGGLIELRSEVGAGTTVMMLLPSVSEAATGPEPTQPVKAHQAGETVLVVEDEELVLDVAKRILVQHGYHVLVARSGTEALDVIKRHHGTIDLLLTDVVMPGSTGKEVAQRISVLRPEIRVLYMSGYPESVVASQGVIDHGIRLISKPFQAVDLLEHIRAVLDAEPTVEPIS